LGLEDELERFWAENARFGPLQRWMQALREVVLGSAGAPPAGAGTPPNPSAAGIPPGVGHNPSPAIPPGEPPSGAGGPPALPAPRVVIFLDEIDIVRSLPFSTDEFFAAIRECHNRRTADPAFDRLTFCLLGVATPSDLIRDTRLTPFNIGRRIELNDFTETEAASLSKGLSQKEPIARRLVQRTLYWTGGHPYLTQRLCRAVAEDASATSPSDVDRHCQALFLSRKAREQDDNLIFVRERLLHSEVDRAALLDCYARVRKGQRVVDDDTSAVVSVLKLSGVVSGGEGRLRLRNRVYRQAFDRDWILSNLPQAELRRQRAAFRRGMVGATVGVVMLLVLLSLPLFKAPAVSSSTPAAGLTNVVLPKPISPSNPAVVLEMEGAVEILRHGATAWDPGYVGQALRPGDRLRTGERSRALLRLADRSVIRCGELTSVQIGPEGRRSVIELLRGAIHGRGLPDGLRMRTTNATAVIRG
jgi:hypothetical protein